MKAGSSQEWKGKYLFFRTGGKKPKHFICGRVCYHLFPVQIRVRGRLEKTSEISRDVVRRELKTVCSLQGWNTPLDSYYETDLWWVEHPNSVSGYGLVLWSVGKNNSKKRKGKFVVCFQTRSTLLRRSRVQPEWKVLRVPPPEILSETERL